MFTRETCTVRYLVSKFSQTTIKGLYSDFRSKLRQTIKKKMSNSFNLAEKQSVC